MTEILYADPSHLEQVASLFDGYRQFYEQPSDLAGARSFIAERMRRQESVILLALSRTQTAAGFIQLYPMFSSVGMKKIWVLNDLYVHPDFRRSGVGEALMQRAKEYAQADGAQRIMLQTGIDNFFGQALYEKLGYVRDTHSYYYELELRKEGKSS